MATKKKTTRKPQASKKTAPPAADKSETPDNVQPIGPQYQLSSEEMIQWKTIRAKIDLAKEKRELAAAQEEMASMLQQSWANRITERLSLSGKEFSVNGDTGIVQVTGDAKKKGKR